MSTPYVSVIMCTYNGIRYIESAIKSVLRQSFQDFELIVVDDGSTDDTRQRVAQIVDKTRDSRIRLVAHAQNKGCAGAMNTALGEVCGRYIIPMDHDDIAMPRRIELSVAFLEARTDLDGCGAGHVVLGPSWINPLKVTAHGVCSHYTPPAFVAVSTLFGGLLYNPTTCFRASVLKRLAVWHDPTLYTGFDDDFYERLSADGARFAILPDVVLLYQRHAGNLSRSRVDIADSVRTRTARQALARMMPDATAEALHLHDRIVLRDKSLTVAELPAVQAWFERILAVPTASRHFEADALRKVLAWHWQRVCALAACHNLRESIRVYKAFAAVAPYNRNIFPLLYQWQRRAVAHLCGRR